MFKFHLGSLKQNSEKSVKSNIIKTKVLLLLSIIIMLLLTSSRAFSLYEHLKSVDVHYTGLKEHAESYNDQILSNALESGYKLAYYNNRISADNLEEALIREHGKEKLNDVLNNRVYDDEVYFTMYESMNRYFRSNGTRNGNLLVIGTEDGILLAESSSSRSKFNNLKGDKPIVPWNEFYDKMNNPKVTKEAFESLIKKKANGPVILRLDGEYKNNKSYTVDDILKIYKKEGVKGLNGFGFLTLAPITETGDILGNRDNTFMHANDNVKKIYVFRYNDINDYIGTELKLLTQTNINSTADIAAGEQIRHQNILTTTMLLIFNIGNIIILMVLYNYVNTITDELEDVVDSYARKIDSEDTNMKKE